MRKLLVLMFTALIIAPAFAQEQTSAEIKEEPVVAAKEMPKEFVVYSDKNARDNHYIPSGWMGDYGDIKLNDQAMDNPHSGPTSMQFSYSSKKSQQKGWAGVYWQNPANNWGSKKGGFDLTGMTKLTFWARGANGGERIEEFNVGGIMGEYSDPDNPTIRPFFLKQ